MHLELFSPLLVSIELFTHFHGRVLADFSICTTSCGSSHLNRPLDFAQSLLVLLVVPICGGGMEVIGMF